MRILHVNKFAYPKGGAEIYMRRTAAQQTSAGDSVAIFGALPDLAEAVPGVDHVDFAVPDYHRQRTSEMPRTAARVLWSRDAARALGETVDEFRPDVVHLHNYAHQLSSSILPTLTSRSIRVVNTAHDYKLICPAYVAHVGDSDCFKCSHRLSPRLMRDRCHHDSLPWSALVGTEATLVRARSLAAQTLLAPSQFMADRLEDSWLSDRAEIVLVRNPVEPPKQQWQGAGGYLLYVGRLSPEKGVDRLISSVAELGLELVIAGDGPERVSLEELSRGVGTRTTFTGHVGPEALSDLRRDCLAQVIPSNWPENAPLSALEAAAEGVPLVMTRRGGLPELAELGARAVFVDALTTDDLRSALKSLDVVDGDVEWFLTELSWERHLSSLTRVYRSREA